MWKYKLASKENKSNAGISSNDSEQPCKWGIGRTAPSLLICPYLLALIIAVTHSVVFRYLDGRYEKDPDIPSQSHVTAASNVAATVVGILLRFSLAAAFTQHFWYLVRRSPLHLETIESLYTLRGNFWSIFSLRVFCKGWLLVAIALVTWAIPIAMSFPPSAITVESGLDVTSGMQDGIPSLDLSKKWGDNETTSWLNSFASLSKRPYQPYIFPFLSGSQNYFNTKKTLEDLATRTMLKGRVNEMPSPCGLNCTYTLHFDGPLLSCNQSSKNITDSTPTDFTIPVFWANWTTTEGAVNVSTPYSFQLTSIQMGPQDFRSKFSAYKGKPYYGSPELDLFRYTKDEMTCYPRRAEYEVIQSFENGQPTSTTKIGQVHELVPIEDGVRFPEGANTSNWEEMTNSSAVTAYARDANILTLILAMANPLAGSFRTTISPGSVLYDEVLQDDQGRAFLRVSNFLGWNGQRNRTLVDLTPLFIGYNTPTLIPDISKLQFWSGANNIATTSLFHFDEKLMNDMLINVTLSTIAQYNLWGTSANVTRTQSRPQYSFSNPVNILVPYFVSLAVVLPLVTAGFWSLVKNGVPATDHGFLQILMTTRGSRELDHLAAGGCLGGDQNIPPALKKHEVMFGELVGQGSQLPHGWEGEDSSRTRLMAGFGSKDEVVPLRKGEDYGHLNT